MLPRQLRVGDLVDDYCPRERRLSNHAIVALVGEDVRLVRCTTCDTEHEYRGGKVPVGRKKPAAAPPLPPARSVLAEAGAPEPAVTLPPAAGNASLPASPAPAAAAPEQGRPVPMPESGSEGLETPSLHAEFGLHRRLIRATLPRVEGETPVRPIPEFTMHKAAAAGHRHGKPFRHGQGGGQHRPGGKGGPGGPGRPAGQRQGQSEVDGNSVHYRGGGPGQRGVHGGHGSPGGRGVHGSQGQPQGHAPRHRFGGKPPRGPRDH
jgi:translation initiation factor IF-2